MTTSAEAKNNDIRVLLTNKAALRLKKYANNMEKTDFYLLRKIWTHLQSKWNYCLAGVKVEIVLS